MSDFYLDTADGDIRVAPNGDIACTDSSWRNTAQQVYIRVKTIPGDFIMYPNVGTDLNLLRGMQQSELTGELGKQLILTSLKRDNPFPGKNINVKAIPTGPQSIRFDIFVTANARTAHMLSIEQNLGAE